MRVKIYQIDFERDKGRAKFLSMEGLEKFTGSRKVDPDIYQEVFSGELDPMGLEEIYVYFPWNRLFESDVQHQVYKEIHFFKK